MQNCKGKYEMAGMYRIRELGENGQIIRLLPYDEIQTSSRYGTPGYLFR